jgi:hypothetical protein
MKAFLFLLGAAFCLCPSAQSLAAQASALGNWNAVFVGPIGPRPQMVDAVTFNISSGPTGLTGTARASDWPGDLDVSELKLDGDRLTFTGTGKIGWTANGTYHCCPKLVFAGTIKGDEMTLTMVWRSTDSTDDPNKAPLPMKATRVPR